MSAEASRNGMGGCRSECSPEKPVAAGTIQSSIAVVFGYASGGTTYDDSDVKCPRCKSVMDDLGNRLV